MIKRLRWRIMTAAALLGAAVAAVFVLTADPRHATALYVHDHAGVPAGVHVGP